MTASKPLAGIVAPDERLVMIVGNYGSGKTEVSVNLAIALAGDGARVQLADLDIVNPYFRSREARERLERHGIRVVVPPGDQAFADLPIILPEIAGMLHPPEGVVSVFDVGGDDVGAKALAAFRPTIGDGPYELWQVINSKRPFTHTLDGCLVMKQAIEEASRLEVTGLLVNSHLIHDTDPAAVLEGWDLARAVSERTGLPIRCVAVMRDVADAPELARIDAPRLVLTRTMLPPWQQTAGWNVAAPADGGPARRPTPIGRPGRMSIPPPRGDAHGSHRD